MNRTLSYSALAANYGVSGLMGIHWRVREVGPQLTALAAFPWNTSLTARDHLVDFFTAEIGGNLGPEAARIILAVDSYKVPGIISIPNTALPRPDTWVSGPGNIVPNPLPWDTIAGNYSFVDEFMALGTSISDPAAKARFAFWSNSLQYLREAGKLGCAWAEVSACLAKAKPSVCRAGESVGCWHDCPRVLPITITVNDANLTLDKCAEECAPMLYAGVEFGKACFCGTTAPTQPGIACPAAEMPCSGDASEGCGGNCLIHIRKSVCRKSPFDPKAMAEKCYPAWDDMVATAERMMNHILAMVSTTGTLGTVQNLQQHNFPKILNDTIRVFEASLGGPMPESHVPRHVFTGQERLFLTTTRQSIAKGESLQLRAFVLVANGGAPRPPVLHVRAMAGGDPWTAITMALKMAGRSVFQATVPESFVTRDFEYYVTWQGTHAVHTWPPGAPSVPHTVVVLPGDEV